LLNVKLDIPERWRVDACRRQGAGIEPELANGVGEADAGGVDARQQRGVERAGDGTAADERHAEADTFFFGEADDFDEEWQAPAAERFDQCNAHHHAEDAIEGAGPRHGVEV
jgi:hypothetical protein